MTRGTSPATPHVEAYRNREVKFQYRKREYIFSLSLGLFSSAGIDTGSRFLLKVFSDYLDDPGSKAARLFSGESPLAVLDSGCGAGVLGICAAGALSALVPQDLPESLPGGNAIRIRAQDRDELARIFTEFNAEKNGLNSEIFEAHTEPLLAGPPGQNWDLILTNIPAKAGLPVLEDFIRRSAGLLKKNGRVFLVAVNTLADFFRSRIGGSLLKEESGKEHTVFVYGHGAETGTGTCDPIILDEAFPARYPFYIRNRAEYKMENISFRLDTVHGAPGFDSPGAAMMVAANLAMKIDLAAKLAAARLAVAKLADVKHNGAGLLIHEGGQGHFALWLAHYLGPDHRKPEQPFVLSGRNIVALAAARAALVVAQNNPASGFPVIIPSADIFLDRERLAATLGSMAGRSGFVFIAYFPEAVPDTDRREAAWEGLAHLCTEGGIVIAGMGSSESERFDRKKPPSFVRLGDIKRNGFRVMAYQMR